MMTVLRTLALGTAGGAVFYWIGIPLAWMLGALAATTLISLTVGGLRIPKLLRNVFLGLLGVTVGSEFMPDIFTNVSEWLLVVGVLFAYLLVIAPAGYLFFRRVGRLDPVSAYFSALPGGMSEVTFIGASLGADIRQLALIHSMRVIAIVFTVPTFFYAFGKIDGSTLNLTHAYWPLSIADVLVLLACGFGGVWVGRKLRFPAPMLLGPLLLSAAAHLSGLTSADPPDWFLAPVQVVLGCAIGSRFARGQPGQVARPLILGLIWGLLLVALAVGFAAFAATVGPAEMAELVLALTPGGLSEMVVLTIALGADVALVSACHLLRITLIYVATPVLIRIAGWKAGDD